MFSLTIWGLVVSHLVDSHHLAFLECFSAGWPVVMGAPEIRDTKNHFRHTRVDLAGRAELALVGSLSEHALTGASVVWKQVSQGWGARLPSFLEGGRSIYPETVWFLNSVKQIFLFLSVCIL